MRRYLMFSLAAIVASICLFANIAFSSETTEGQVVKVDQWTLFVSTGQGEPVAFNPYWVNENGSWQPKRPARNILPALEAGETVRVTWTMDTRENRRRIDNIEVTSAKEGVSRGTVVRVSATELVFKPQEKPGTVTLNNKFVQINGKWVPDPTIAQAITGLPREARITVRWAWDNEGRKRIISVQQGW